MSKISELSDGGALQSTDYLIAVRSGGNVKVRPNGTVTGTTGSFSGNVTFADNAKAIFGAGSDLQIYHTGAYSAITDVGTGDFFIGGDGFVDIGNSSLSLTRARFSDSSSALYQQGNIKLATTATGIDVTGTAVTDGLTVAGNVSVDGGTITLDGNKDSLGNVALGNNSLLDITTGGENTGIGSGAGGNITTGTRNTALGFSSLAVTTTGSYNTALGNRALNDQTTASNNTAVGYDALGSNTTASNNTAVGYQSLYSNTTGAENTAVGRGAVAQNSTGNYNSGFGYQALASNTTGSSNTAVGHNVLVYSTTSSNNTAVGFEAGYLNTTGTLNSFFGSYAGYSNTTPNNNSFIGSFAGYSNTTGTTNTALGQAALQNNTTASYNTALGYQAGYNNTTGQYSAFLGHQAGYFTTGGTNTFVGQQAGQQITTGASNTIIGRYSGNQGGLDIRTSSNNIVLSDGDGNPRGYFEPAGSFVVSSGTNKGIQILGSGYTVGTAGLSLGQYTSTRVYAQMPPSGQFEVWASNTGAVATFYENGNLNVTGALSKGSGSFRIPHPLPELSETHDLVHSFIEGPQADNIYRGKVTLVAGMAEVNIDNVAGMTEGTFALLNREVQCFTSNESGWTAVRGTVDGNILTIEAQDPACTDTISWMVVGERQDQHMFDTDWTDENGKVIVEPTRKLDQSPADSEALKGA